MLRRAFNQDKHGIIKLQELRDVSSDVKVVAKESYNSEREKSHTTTTSWSSPGPVTLRVISETSKPLSLSFEPAIMITQPPRVRNQLNIINRLHASTRQEEEIQRLKFQILINQREIGLPNPHCKCLRRR